MAMNLFGSSLEEIQTRAKQQAEVRRVRAMQQAAQQGASPINTAMAGFGNQIGTRLFGGDQPSEADKLRALSEEDITANMMQYGLDTPAKAINASNLAFQAGHLEMGMKLQKYGKSLITPSNEVNIYDWKGNNAPRQIRYTPSTGMYQLDGETITSKQLNDLGWNKVPRAATRGTGTGTGTGKPTINSQWNAVIKLNETSKNLISEQVAANPVFKTFIMGLSLIHI